MSKALRLFALAIIGCLLQTNAAQFIQFAGVTPDLMIAMIVALTSFSSMSGCFCTAALMIMFYDASVGYVMALNPIAYILVALAASWLRAVLNARLIKLKHKSFLIIALICFALVLGREIAYVVYLYLIGAEMSATTILRMFLCAGYTAAMSIPCILLIRFVMNWHPFISKKRSHANMDMDGEEYSDGFN